MPAHVLAPPPEARFASPSGRWDVGLLQVALRPGGSADVRLRVYPPGGRLPVAEAKLVDIFDGASPHPLAQVFRTLSFSPHEDAVLWTEDWGEGGDGEPPTEVLALDPRWSWQTATFQLAHTFWADPAHLVGDVRDGCRWSVARFDLPTGRTTTLLAGGGGALGEEAHAPGPGPQLGPRVRGGVVVSWWSTGCSGPLRPTGRCERLDLRTWRVTPTACPATP